MAASSGQVSVGTSATLIATPAKGGTLVLAHRGTAEIFLGGSAVAIGTGMGILANEVINFPIAAGIPIYGIVAAATEELNYLLVE
jgi:hypothetical protein